MRRDREGGRRTSNFTNWPKCYLYLQLSPHS
nr:unnamed protein product [Callosobruchus analis]